MKVEVPSPRRPPAPLPKQGSLYQETGKQVGGRRVPGEEGVGLGRGHQVRGGELWNLAEAGREMVVGLLQQDQAGRVGGTARSLPGSRGTAETARLPPALDGEGFSHWQQIGGHVDDVFQPPPPIACRPGVPPTPGCKTSQGEPGFLHRRPPVSFGGSRGIWIPGDRLGEASCPGWGWQLSGSPFFWGSVSFLTLHEAPPRPPGPLSVTLSFPPASFSLHASLSVSSSLPAPPPALPGPVGLPSACEGLLLQDNAVSAEIRTLLSSYYSDR